MYSQNPLTVVHVDDNPGSLKSFEHSLTRFPGVKYLQGFTCPEKAFDFISSETVDLAFLDIEMPGKDGLWLANQVKEKDTEIVFLTSHAQFALHAFEICALDYILKPACENRILNIIKKYSTGSPKNSNCKEEQIKDLCSQYMAGKPGFPQRIFINLVGQIVVIRLEEVLYFKANENYTVIMMKDGRKYTTSKTIKLYDEVVSGHPDFLRIHRSYIVNKNSVSSIIRRGKQHKFLVQMDNKDELEMSYTRKDEIMEKLMN